MSGLHRATSTGALPEFAADINRGHEQCQAAFEKSLEHALKAGRLLLEAKDQAGHGAWLPWAEQNFAGSVRTAQGYRAGHGCRWWSRGVRPCRDERL